MEFKELVDLSLAVLKDARVIFIAIFTISMMMLGSYVVSYRKKPPKIKKIKAKPAPEAKPDEEKKEENGDGNKDE